MRSLLVCVVAISAKTPNERAEVTIRKWYCMWVYVHRNQLTKFHFSYG
jgi:hypothetical protein